MTSTAFGDRRSRTNHEQGLSRNHEQVIVHRVEPREQTKAPAHGNEFVDPTSQGYSTQPNSRNMTWLTIHVSEMRYLTRAKPENWLMRPAKKFKMGTALVTGKNEFVRGRLGENASLGLAMCADTPHCFPVSSMLRVNPPTAIKSPLVPVLCQDFRIKNGPWLPKSSGHQFCESVNSALISALTTSRLSVSNAWATSKSGPSGFDLASGSRKDGEQTFHGLI